MMFFLLYQINWGWVDLFYCNFIFNAVVVLENLAIAHIQLLDLGTVYPSKLLKDS